MQISHTIHLIRDQELRRAAAEYYKEKICSRSYSRTDHYDGGEQPEAIAAKFANDLKSRRYSLNANTRPSPIYVRSVS